MNIQILRHGTVPLHDLPFGAQLQCQVAFILLNGRIELLCVPIQGLMKEEGKQKFGSQYTMWQKQASEFEIDNQAPVR